MEKQRELIKADENHSTWQLQNIGARIREIKRRIQSLERLENIEFGEREFCGGKIVQNKEIIDIEKFLAYYMTVSGHLNYTTNGNCMASKNWEAVKNLQYSHKAKSYLACQIELDKAIGELIRRLEFAGKLEDTVIVISPDHYPYGLTLSELNELSTYKRDNKFERHHTPLLIWNSSMEEPIKIEKVCSSLDVLPTVLNLFGIEYDSRLLMRKDILSNNIEPIVIFSDRNFITDKKRYNSVQDVFIPNEGETLEPDYVE